MTDVHIAGLEEEEIDTVLAGDVDFAGTLEFSKPLMIKGKFSGLIKSSGDLYVSEGAQVRANVRARMVSVKGFVMGDLDAVERIELASTCRLDGNIVSPEVVMEAGCQFNGVSRMAKKEEA